MEKSKFQNIIDFAIEREQDAVEFYQDLQKKVKFQAQQEMLKELEEMEKGHIRILKNVFQEGKISQREQQVKDLHISDYIVPVEPSANMSYEEILIVAMKREEASKLLYTNMASAVQEEELKRIFRRLASEEAGHKLKFEKLYDDEVLKEN